MIKRDTESKHIFADDLFQTCSIYDLQGLLLNENYEFTAAIEGVYLKENENWRELDQFFTEDEIHSKLLLAEKLKIPFYIICHSLDSSDNHKFEIIKHYRNSEGISYDLEATYDESNFVKWWKELKGTIQTKGFREGAIERTLSSHIDTVLAKNGLMWGGNIDGIILSEDKSEIKAIIEKRICNENKKIEYYNPAEYFYNASDPLRNDYFTWKPLIKLAIDLNCPLYLMTFQNNVNNKFGIGHVKNILNGLNYYNQAPNLNIKETISDYSVYVNHPINQSIPTMLGNCNECGDTVDQIDADVCVKKKDDFKGKIYCENCRTNFNELVQGSPTCDYQNCNKVISASVKEFCDNNKSRFNNKYYCYNHQKNF